MPSAPGDGSLTSSVEAAEEHFRVEAIDEERELRAQRGMVRCTARKAARHARTQCSSAASRLSVAAPLDANARSWLLAGNSEVGASAVAPGPTPMRRGKPRMYRHTRRTRLVAARSLVGIASSLRMQRTVARRTRST